MTDATWDLHLHKYAALAATDTLYERMVEVFIWSFTSSKRDTSSDGDTEKSSARCTASSLSAISW